MCVFCVYNTEIERKEQEQRDIAEKLRKEQAEKEELERKNEEIKKAAAEKAGEADKKKLEEISVMLLKSVSLN